MAADDIKLTMIRDLRPGMKNVTCVFIVIDKGTTNLIKDGSVVRKCRVADRSGSIFFSLWNEQAEAVEAGDILKLTKGYSSLWKGTMVLYSGKYGILQKIGEFTMTYSDHPDMSDSNQEFLQPQQQQTRGSSSTSNGGAGSLPPQGTVSGPPGMNRGSGMGSASERTGGGNYRSGNGHPTRNENGPIPMSVTGNRNGNNHLIGTNIILQSSQHHHDSLHHNDQVHPLNHSRGSDHVMPPGQEATNNEPRAPGAGMPLPTQNFAHQQSYPHHNFNPQHPLPPHHGGNEMFPLDSQGTVNDGGRGKFDPRGQKYEMHHQYENGNPREQGADYRGPLHSNRSASNEQQRYNPYVRPPINHHNPNSKNVWR